MSKPFIARGSRVERCQNCLLTPRTCICDYRVSYEAKAQFYLLMHYKEAYKPTNTGRLIEDCLSDTQRFTWSRTEPDSSLISALQAPDIDPYIVFPEGPGYEERMVDYQPKPGKRPVFILLDGTWRQARRMFRHSEYLQDLPVIQPQITRPSEYRLRKAAVEGQLCTAEVAAEMLYSADDRKGGDLLSAYFSIFNQHYRASRLSRPLEGSEEKDLIRRYQKRLTL